MKLDRLPQAALRRIDDLGRQRSSSLLAVLAARLGSASLQLAVAASIVAAVGTDAGGRFFANVAGIELAALAARLGMPTVLARAAALGADRRRLAGGVARLPVSVLAVAPVAAGLGLVLAAIFDRPTALLAGGAAAVSVGQCCAGWLRGFGRPALGAILHPLPALLAALVALTVLPTSPTTAYVAGAALAASVAVAAVLLGSGGFGPNLRRTQYRSAVLLGGAELANQAVFLAPPLILVRYASPDAALVFGLAVRLVRPLTIVRFAVIQTFGPGFAGERHEPLQTSQRRLASTTSGVMTGAGLIYAAVAVPLVLRFNDQLVGGAGAPPTDGSGALAMAGTTAPLADQLFWAWAVVASAAVLNLATGPTGQLLAMRDFAGHSLRASVLALGCAPLALVLGFSPAVTAAVAVAIAEGTQALATGLVVRRQLGWASPLLGGSPT
jgi:hypothetical protein